jgi:hypothetical protein
MRDFLKMLLLPAALCTFVTACATGSGPNNCAIAPPKNYEGNREAAAKAGADLTALASAPVKADFEASFKETVKQTFQAIPERDVACQMLLQTVACLSEKRNSQNSVNTLLSYIKEDDKCETVSAKEKADAHVLDTLKDLIHLEAGQAPVYAMIGWHCENYSEGLTEQLNRQAKRVLEHVRGLQAATAATRNSDIVVVEYGTFRQLVLDLAARERILTYLSGDPSTLDRSKICSFTTEYEDLHRRLAVIEAAYHRYLEQTPRFSQIIARKSQ